jgi:hypothetical protein
VVLRIPSPPVGDLHGVVAGCLALTHRAVRALEITAGLDAEKVVGEALLLLRATRRDAHTQRWHDLYAATAPLARPHTLAASLCRDPSRAAELAFGHVMLTDLGHPDAKLDLLLDLALADEPTGPTPYVVPALQRQWLLDVRSNTHGTRHELVERSSLAHPVDLLRCSTQDAYDLTHAVMHGTDLGAWPLTAPRPEHELAADLDALLGLALDADNLDLTTELLWAWPMLGLRWTPAARLALDVVLRTHRDHGYLPGPGHDPASPGAGAEVLTTSYHATLVLGILAAALLRTGALPDRITPDRVTVAGSLLLAELDDGRHPWLDAVRGRHDGLAPTLLAVALRRASDRADLADVRRLLELAVRLGLADGRAVVQATGLLRRGTALARYVASSGLRDHQVHGHHLPEVVHEQLDREVVDARR